MYGSSLATRSYRRRILGLPDCGNERVLYNFPMRVRDVYSVLLQKEGACGSGVSVSVNL
jgi:hypothetical protein